MTATFSRPVDVEVLPDGRLIVAGSVRSPEQIHALAAVQHLAPATMRTTASASFLLINNLIGLGVGPTLIGGLSELFKERFGIEALRYAAVSVVGFYVLASFLMFFAVSRLARDWVEDERTV